MPVGERRQHLHLQMESEDLRRDSRLRIPCVWEELKGTRYVGNFRSHPDGWDSTVCEREENKLCSRVKTTLLKTSGMFLV